MLLLLVAVMVVFGRTLAPYDPQAFHAGHRLETPSLQFLLGTDNFGRDILSRVLHGGASVILLPLLAVSAAMVVATLVGLVSG